MATYYFTGINYISKTADWRDLRNWFNVPKPVAATANLNALPGPNDDVTVYSSITSIGGNTTIKTLVLDGSQAPGKFGVVSSSSPNLNISDSSNSVLTVNENVDMSFLDIRETRILSKGNISVAGVNKGYNNNNPTYVDPCFSQCSLTSNDIRFDDATDPNVSKIIPCEIGNVSLTTQGGTIYANLSTTFVGDVRVYNVASISQAIINFNDNSINNSLLVSNQDTFKITYKNKSQNTNTVNFKNPVYFYDYSANTGGTVISYGNIEFANNSFSQQGALSSQQEIRFSNNATLTGGNGIAKNKITFSDNSYVVNANLSAQQVTFNQNSYIGGYGNIYNPNGTTYFYNSSYIGFAATVNSSAYFFDQSFNSGTVDYGILPSNNTNPYLYYGKFTKGVVLSGWTILNPSNTVYKLISSITNGLGVSSQSFYTTRTFNITNDVGFFDERNKPITSINLFGTSTYGDIIYNKAQATGLTPLQSFSTVTFYNSSYNTSLILSSITNFRDFSFNVGKIKANPSNSSYFYDKSFNGGIIENTKSTYFYNSSFNIKNSLSLSSYFYDSSFNGGTVNIGIYDSNNISPYKYSGGSSTNYIQDFSINSDKLALRNIIFNYTDGTIYNSFGNKVTALSLYGNGKYYSASDVGISSVEIYDNSIFCGFAPNVYFYNNSKLTYDLNIIYPYDEAKRINSNISFSTPLLSVYSSFPPLCSLSLDYTGNVTNSATFFDSSYFFGGSIATAIFNTNTPFTTSIPTNTVVNSITKQCYFSNNFQITGDGQTLALTGSQKLTFYCPAFFNSSYQLLTSVVLYNDAQYIPDTSSKNNASKREIECFDSLSAFNSSVVDSPFGSSKPKQAFFYQNSYNNFDTRNSFLTAYFYDSSYNKGQTFTAIISSNNTLNFSSGAKGNKAIYNTFAQDQTLILNFNSNFNSNYTNIYNSLFQPLTSLILKGSCSLKVFPLSINSISAFDTTKLDVDLAATVYFYNSSYNSSTTYITNTATFFDLSYNLGNVDTGIVYSTNKSFITAGSFKQNGYFNVTDQTFTIDSNLFFKNGSVLGSYFDTQARPLTSIVFKNTSSLGLSSTNTVLPNQFLSAVFYDSTKNYGGLQNSNTRCVFKNNSINFGNINRASFYDNSINGLFYTLSVVNIALSGTGKTNPIYRFLRVNNLSSGRVQNIAEFYDNSSNTGTLLSAAYFYNNSLNVGLTLPVSSEKVLNSNVFVTQPLLTAYFYDDSSNTGSINTAYFYNNSKNNFINPFTYNTTAITGTPGIGSQYPGGATNKGTNVFVVNTATLSNYSVNYNPVDNITLYNSSSSIGATINIDAVLYDDSINTGNVARNLISQDNSYNTASVGGSAWFGGSNINNLFGLSTNISIGGNAVFATNQTRNQTITLTGTQILNRNIGGSLLDIQYRPITAVSLSGFSSIQISNNYKNQLLLANFYNSSYNTTSLANNLTGYFNGTSYNQGNVGFAWFRSDRTFDRLNYGSITNFAVFDTKEVSETQITLKGTQSLNLSCYGPFYNKAFELIDAINLEENSSINFLYVDPNKPSQFTGYSFAGNSINTSFSPYVRGTFTENSSNAGVIQQAIFRGNSKNTGWVMTDGAFYNKSRNSGGSVGNALFFDQSYNDGKGGIYATFSNFNTNKGLSGTSTFGLAAPITYSLPSKKSDKIIPLFPVGIQALSANSIEGPLAWFSTRKNIYGIDRGYLNVYYTNNYLPGYSVIGLINNYYLSYETTLGVNVLNSNPSAGPAYITIPTENVLNQSYYKFNCSRNSEPRTYVIVCKPNFDINDGKQVLVGVGPNKKTADSFSVIYDPSTQSVGVDCNGTYIYSSQQWALTQDWFIMSVVVPSDRTNVGAIQLYLNGILLNPDNKLNPGFAINTNVTHVANSNEFVIGSYSGNLIGSNPFYGKIMDVLIYNRALKPSEIFDLYSYYKSIIKI